jgi:hypothetical protein
MPTARRKTRLQESTTAGVGGVTFSANEADELKGLLSSGMKARGGGERERARRVRLERERRLLFRAVFYDAVLSCIGCSPFVRVLTVSCVRCVYLGTGDFGDIR